eukprot:792065-Pelagomonas_calceolata.AAC.2
MSKCGHTRREGEDFPEAVYFDDPRMRMRPRYAACSKAQPHSPTQNMQHSVASLKRRGMVHAQT